MPQPAGLPVRGRRRLRHPARSLLELAVVDDHRPDLDGDCRAARATATSSTSAIAASRSGTSMTLNPPMTSFASENGPSTTTGPPAPCLTVVAVVTGCSSAPESSIFSALLAEPLVDPAVDLLRALLRHRGVEFGRGREHDDVLHGRDPFVRGTVSSPQRTDKAGIDIRAGEILRRATPG